MEDLCIWTGSESFPLNWKNRTDGLILLSAMADGVVTTAFFDPQYRGVLDKLSYGNEGRQRGQARAALRQMDEETIVRFIQEIDRVLKPRGHLFLWVDKFHLCQGILPWVEGTSLNLVDMIVWDKGKIGMGYRTRRKSEYLMVFQKSPVRAKGVWMDHAIPDVWVEKVTKTHAHSKPVELQRRLICATTEEGDLVLDPASGGYSVLEACRRANRSFIGGDIMYGEEVPLEIERKFLIRMPEEKWLDGCPGHRVREITQTYLDVADPAVDRRVRRCEEDGRIEFFVTEKREVPGGDGAVRHEDERRIDEDEYRRMLDGDETGGANCLTKTRHVVPYEEHVLEIDMYPFDERLAILEVEVDDVDEEVALPPEIKIVREVTGIDAYRNRSVATHHPSGLGDLG